VGVCMPRRCGVHDGYFFVRIQGWHAMVETESRVGVVVCMAPICMVEAASSG
jgi:hypothetical protein